MVLALATLIAAVLALALFDRAADSTAELVRLLRTPNAPAAIVDPGLHDAAPFDRMPFALDASLPIMPPEASPAYAVRPIAALRVDQPAGTDEAMSDADASMADGADAGTASSPTPVVGSVAPDASAKAARDVASVDQGPVKSEPPAPVRCGWRTCESGQQCCNWNCSTCVSPGETCPLFCGAPAAPVSVPCGPNTCNVSEICCNASCGICVPSGGTCSKEPCAGMYVPVSVTCGMNTCNAGQICCNPSCGTCTNPGETCSLDPCP